MKLNRNLLLHGSLLIGLLIYVIFIFMKFIPISFQHVINNTVYICQTYLQKFFWLFPYIFGFLTIHGLIRLALTLCKTYRYRKSLKKIGTPRTISKIEREYDLQSQIIVVSDKNH